MSFQFKALTEDHEWNWIAARAHPLRCADSQGLVAYDDNGIIQAVCVMDSWTPDTCQVHFAIDNKFVIRGGFLNEIARHCFVTCGRKRIFGLVPSNNDRAIRLDRHIGFTEVARVPHGYSEGVDYIVFGMDKADCRWLNSPKTEAEHVKQRAA